MRIKITENKELNRKLYEKLSRKLYRELDRKLERELYRESRITYEN